VKTQGGISFHLYALARSSRQLSLAGIEALLNSHHGFKILNSITEFLSYIGIIVKYYYRNFHKFQQAFRFHSSVYAIMKVDFGGDLLNET
jgi:hypothetical protein